MKLTLALGKITQSFMKHVIFLSIILTALTPAANAKNGPVDINTADIRQLMSLPYIGEKRAEAIIESRRRFGKFITTRELVTRKVIGQKTFEAIERQISVYTIPVNEETRPINITNININGLTGNIFFLDNDNFIRVLSAKIQESRETIRIAMYLFKISTNKYNYASQLFERIVMARQRGVEVEVILEYSDFNHSLNESNAYTLKRLKDSGIKVRLDVPETQTHTKLIIIDDRYTFIGSHNFSHSALGRNNELSLMVDSVEIAEKSTEYYKSIQ